MKVDVEHQIVTGIVSSGWLVQKSDAFKCAYDLIKEHELSK